MIECSSCHTLNPELEPSCLACGHPLGRPGAVPKAAFGGDRCPEGHPVDPSWKSCPYCDRLRAGSAGARQPTRLEGESPAASAPAAFRPTRIEPPAEPVGGRRTLLQPGSGPEIAGTGSPGVGPGQPGLGPVPVPAPLAARRLLAVLAAPDLGPGGTVFAVRSGRNTLGADRSNDIVLGLDSEVSAEHAVILHRNGAFQLADRLSTNGTWLNGEEVPANGTCLLRDRDRIRCGGTELQLLVLDPAGLS